ASLFGFQTLSQLSHPPLGPEARPLGALAGQLIPRPPQFLARLATDQRGTVSPDVAEGPVVLTDAGLNGLPREFVVPPQRTRHPLIGTGRLRVPPRAAENHECGLWELRTVRHEAPPSRPGRLLLQGNATVENQSVHGEILKNRSGCSPAVLSLYP